jgi:hypothetical protein
VSDEFREDFNLGDPKPRPALRPVPEGWRLIPGVDLVDYYADNIGAPHPSLSNSLMQPLLDKTPRDAAFEHPRLNPEHGLEKAKTTAALRRGDVVHQLALDRGRGYRIGNFKDWRTKTAKEFKEAAEEAGETPITRSAFEEAEIMAGIVKERIKRVLDGAAYDTEVAFLYEERTAAGPIWVRGLMDVYCEEKGLIVDPKVTGLLYDKVVGRQMVNMGWDRQLALYERGVGMIRPHLAGRVRARDLMINPDPPYTSRLVAPEKAWKYSSVKQAEEAMEIFGECLHSGRWPGFGDDVDYIPCPPWEAKRREKHELGEI